MNDLEIYGTLGPSCCKQETIEKMFQVGMTGMRLNLSHCNLEDRKDWIASFHHAQKKLGINAQFLIDVKGPELRLSQDDEVTYLVKNAMGSWGRMLGLLKGFNHLKTRFIKNVIFC